MHHIYIFEVTVRGNQSSHGLVTLLGTTMNYCGACSLQLANELLIYRVSMWSAVELHSAFILIGQDLDISTLTYVSHLLHVKAFDFSSRF